MSVEEIWGHCNTTDWQKIIFKFLGFGRVLFFSAQWKKQFYDFWKPQVAKPLFLNRFLGCKWKMEWELKSQVQIFPVLPAPKPLWASVVRSLEGANSNCREFKLHRSTFFFLLFVSIFYQLVLTQLFPFAAASLPPSGVLSILLLLSWQMIHASRSCLCLIWFLPGGHKAKPLWGLFSSSPGAQEWSHQ